MAVMLVCDGCGGAPAQVRTILIQVLECPGGDINQIREFEGGVYLEVEICDICLEKLTADIDPRRWPKRAFHAPRRQLTGD